ncbi:phosphomannomutase/phosphoglucomutase, partial [Eubacteriales bacterium OttesenSCG-928-N14]|nr:phosphomannomutase/phosphoglucomutase [Eubacteriales bacterium OttesenSCG-928-N14]
MADYAKLQNGSDVRGIALGEEKNLTDAAVRDIACAFAQFVSAKTNTPLTQLRIGIGRDSRISGEHIMAQMMQALQQMGVWVYDCGMASTPAMYMATITPGYEYDGAMMVTASHLPPDRNGIKFFTASGGTDKADVSVILQQAAQGVFAASAQMRPITQVDFIAVYAEQLCDIIRKAVHAKDYDKPLSPFHIVVDAGNGAGGFYVDNVLVPLGATTTGSQFLQPDGNFPNHVPNPEDPAAMEAICHAVLQHQADLGIIFDTDVDRAAVVDASGKDISRNRLIALMSAIVLSQSPSSTIVTDSVTSTGLAQFIAQLGGKHHRFQRGYKNVIDEAIRLNKAGEVCEIAIETSGHGALKENHFLDDGAYLVTKILITMAQLHNEGRQIGALIASLKEPAESMEFRMNIAAEDFSAYGQQVLRGLEDYAKQQNWEIAPDNYEGLRVNFPRYDGDGWFLLRMSLHDPLMPLNIESDTAGGCKVIGRYLLEYFGSCAALDS